MKKLQGEYVSKWKKSIDGDWVSDIRREKNHCIFKPPFNLELLELDNEAEWISESHNCIQWIIGLTLLHPIASIITDCGFKTNRIPIKEMWKADYVRKYVSKPLSELDKQHRLENVNHHVFTILVIIACVPEQMYISCMKIL